jgi:hypothetical protein
MSSIMTGRLRRKQRHTRIEKFHTSSTAQVSPPPAPVEPAPVEPAPVEPSAVDYGILELSIVNLAKELSSGDHDSSLPELIEAENAGKHRKGALAALEERLP